MSQYPLLMRVIANSLCVANRAGQVIRQIMESGNLGIVEKTGKNEFVLIIFFELISMKFHINSRS